MSASAMLSILLCFAFNALYAGAETGSYMINRIRLRRRTQHRRHSARVLSWTLKDAHIFIFTMLCGQNVAVYILTTTVTGLYIAGGISAHDSLRLLGFIPWNAEMAATITLMFPLFLFAEVGPKNLFRKKADQLMYRFAGLLRLTVLCFYPFTFILKHLFHLLTRHAHEEVERELHHLSSDGLKEYFSVGEKEGIISSEQNRMIDNATSMHGVSVRTLMTPLKKTPCLPDDASVTDLRRLLTRYDTTYAMLMHRHEVVGMISLFTVINRKLDADQKLLPYVEEVLRLEEDRNVKSAFYRLRRNPHHCAVIIDTRGHPAGFVQMEDVARYIIG